MGNRTCAGFARKLRSDNRSGFCYKCRSYAKLTPYGRQANCDRSRKIHAAFRIKIAAIKVGRGCADCGYDRYPEALDFDHRPGSVKTKSVALMWNFPWERVLAEIDKCDVVCANCHRHRTKVRSDASKALAASGSETPRLTPTRLAVAACGTESGYNLHRRQEETPCAGCKAAKAAAGSRRYRAAKSARLQAGTTTAIGNQVAVGC